MNRLPLVMWTVCRSVGPSFANPHNIFLACRLPLHFDPFAAALIPPRVTKFRASGLYTGGVGWFSGSLSRNLNRLPQDIWTVCHKIFEPFATRHLNRLPQDIWTVCLYTWLRISEPKAGIACLWLSHTRVMATARKGHTKCSPKQTTSSHFVLENVPPIHGEI